jgi:hypothetical protein
MNKRLLGTTILVMVCWATLAAQDKAKPAGKDAGKPPQAQAMQMPAPAPEMTKLIKSLGGTWTVTEKHDPSPMMPKGGTGKGTATLTPGPGNLSLVEKYHSMGAMGNFTGMGVFWWDPAAKVYHGLWCDNMTPNGCDASGTTKWDGDKLVGNMEMDMGGQKMVMRFTYANWKPNSFTMTMEMGPSTDKLQKSMTVTYTKGGTTTAKMEKPAQ